MLKIIILITTALLLTLQATPLLKTGQTTSYQDYDDGDYRVGEARSYSRVGDIVTDNVTGLEWQDDADANSTQLPRDEAIGYCESFSLGGYDDWRLPTQEELLTLVDSGEYNPSVTEGAFQYISSSIYWSSTTYVSSTLSAWYVHFYGGDSDSYHKSHNNYVRCVRGGQLDNLNFSRDDATEVVTESVTDLQWQDNEEVNSTTRTFSAAVEYCEDLTFATHDDWRLPNINELLFIVDYANNNPVIESTFQYISSSNYWSSTTYAGYTSNVWGIHFYNGNSYNYGKAANTYVRCVRGGQYNLLIPHIPVNVNASDEVFVDSVHIDWDVTPRVDFYRLYRSDSADSDGSQIEVVTENSYVDDSVEFGTRYYYRVKACRGNECSDLSEADSGYIEFLPPIPTNTQASDATFEEYVKVSWDATPNTSEYRLYRSEFSGTEGTQIASRTSNSYTDSAVEFGIRYYYSVKSCNDNGCSELSESDSGYIGLLPPETVSVSEGIDDLIFMEWQEVALSSYYEVYRSTSKDVMGALIDAPTEAELLDLSIDVDIEYFYRVKACNDAGCSAYSEAFSGYAGELPPSGSVNPSLIMYLLN